PEPLARDGIPGQPGAVKGLTGRVRRSVSSMALLSVLAGSASSARGYEEGPVGDAGTLAGVVRFAGTPPKPARLPVAKHPVVCGEPKESESLVLGADRGVKDAVVRIE